MGFFFDEAAPPADAEREALLASIRAAGNRGVHNFSLGSLITYFRLGSLPREQIIWERGVLRLLGLPGSSPNKAFIFDAAGWAPAELAQLQRDFIVYSLDKLDLPKRSRFKETCYDLARVFDPASYPNSKKRYQRLVWPPKHLVRHGIAIVGLQPRDLPAIEALHAAWVAFKLAQPATIRMMFPKARYLACLRLALADPARYFAYGAWQEGRLLACRALYIEDYTAFDLAYFAATWAAPSNLVECMSHAVMTNLAVNQIDRLNCGAGLNKSLEGFKSHWPHENPISYAYGRLKEDR